MKTIMILIVGLLVFSMHTFAQAVNVAPRISDREIIESLATLKQGQADLNRRFDDSNRSMDKRFEAEDKRFDDLNRSIDKRFDAVDQRFEAVDKRFDAIDKRFDDLNRSIDKRFDSVDQRITDLQTTMLALAGGVFALIISMFGYIAWDRRTYMRPMQKQLDQHEIILHKELDITHDAGSVLARLIKALRELAKTDQRLAEVLRSFSLL